MTHPIDRFVRRIRPLIFMAYLPLMPVFLLSYGEMVRLFLTTWPWYVGLIVVLAHFVSALVLASLIDMQQERHPSKEPLQ